MERSLPLVEIVGTEFYVDVLSEELRGKLDPKNRISFNVFSTDEKGYSFLYDTEKKCAASKEEDIEALGTRYRWVTLPALMELDPQGIALKYGIPLEFLNPQGKAGEGQPFGEDQSDSENPDSSIDY